MGLSGWVVKRPAGKEDAVISIVLLGLVELLG
jgi:hypothetical protein